jgi:galactonate dehydratase
VICYHEDWGVIKFFFLHSLSHISELCAGRDVCEKRNIRSNAVSFLMCISDKQIRFNSTHQTTEILKTCESTRLKLAKADNGLPRRLMKITEIKTFLMQAGSPTETAWSAAGSGGMSTAGARNWCFVKVYTDAGVTGIGECSGWPRVAEAAVRDLSHVLIGQNPQDIERLWQRMSVAIMGHGQTGVVGYGAIAGLDMALWDIKGKVLNTPVWNLLGGKVRDRIRAYSHASTVENAKSLVARGYTAIKTGGVANPLEKLADLRAALGEEIDLMVDLHGPPWLTAADAISMCREMEQFHPLFVEEPVAPEAIDAFRRVRDRTSVPLAAGERLAGLFGERQLIVEGLVDVIQPDTGRAGGLTQLKKIAALAEAHFIDVAPHAGTLGPIAEVAAVHFLASIPNALILERFEDDWPGKNAVVRPNLESKNGYLTVPDLPGLGVDIDEDFVNSLPSERNCRLPISKGSGAYAAGTEEESVYFQARSKRQQYFSLNSTKKDKS